MKITKKPKKVKIVETTYTGIQRSYTCPTCKTEFHGFVAENTISFKCRCGQVLIIEP